jgi:hypothetical protein
VDPDFNPRHIAKGEVPYLGILFKKSRDHELAAGVLGQRLFR